MKFSPDFIEKVQQANNLVDIISQYSDLRSSGRNLMGRCPFPDHQEKTPSFSVSEDKQVYHCFGCKKSGNIYTFLQTYHGFSFPESVEYLANRAGIELPQNPDFNPQEHDREKAKRRALVECNRTALNFFQEKLRELPAGHSVREYIKKRGLTAETLELFKIGYAPADWESLVHNLRKHKVPLSFASEVGLVKSRPQDAQGFYDIFRDRLMFPIISSLGEVLGFGGRVLQPEQQPKYLNSPESMVFSKGRTLYGLEQTARYLRSEDCAVVVEGYMDLLGLYQAGLKSVVATLGTALTLDHGRILKRLTKNVIVLFDGDQAGQHAAERSLPILLEAGLIPRGLTLPDGLDPDEFVQTKGVAALQEALTQAPDLMFLVLDRYLQGYQGTVQEKMKLLEKLNPIFAKIADPSLRQLYIIETSKKLRVDKSWLEQALGAQKTEKRAAAEPLKSETSTEVSKAQTQNINTINLKGCPPAELYLLAMCLHKETYLKEFLAANLLEHIYHHGVRLAFEKIIESYRQTPEKFDKLVGQLISYIAQPELLTTPLQLAESLAPDEEKKLYADGVKKVKEQALRGRAKALAQELREKPLQDEQSTKLSELVKIQKERLFLRKNKPSN